MTNFETLCKDKNVITAPKPNLLVMCRAGCNTRTSLDQTKGTDITSNVSEDEVGRRCCLHHVDRGQTTPYFDQVFLFQSWSRIRGCGTLGNIVLTTDAIDGNVNNGAYAVCNIQMTITVSIIINAI